MTTSPPASEFSRYRQLLRQLAGASLATFAQLPAAGDGEANEHDQPTVKLGITAAQLLLAEQPNDASVDLDRFVAGFRWLAGQGEPFRFGKGELPLLRDPYGHGRDVYLPLVLQLHLAAFAKHYEQLPPGVWSACEDAMHHAAELARPVEKFADACPDPPGMALAAWQARCLLSYAMLSKRDVDVELVDSIVHRLLDSPGPDGAFHPKSPYDALGEGSDEASYDVWTYRELSGLHALAGLALQRRNRQWAARVEAIAKFHVAFTQPDYTTSQPWGVFAFIWSDACRHFADQQLHDATTYGGIDVPPGSVGLVPAMLLADAAASLGSFA